MMAPNARFQARERAGARHERTLFPVACKPLFGGVRRCSGRLSLVFLSGYRLWARAPPLSLGTALVGGHHLLLGNEGIVIGMRTDPNPIDAVRHIDTQGSVVCANPHRPEIINLFEAEGRMPRIRFQKRVVLSARSRIGAGSARYNAQNWGEA